MPMEVLLLLLLLLLLRSKMSLVLQFELILKIGSIICAYGGRRVGQGCSRSIFNSGNKF
jgi:hypothetical protein